ncbi:MAG: LysR family transcriptional regulator [Lachnospiraceae bacterium]|nr:LysR family transcriptional regulator [Lachnospiraceae bacterium]
MKTEFINEFMKLADTLNFSAASRELFISQPTLSRHIMEMEKELGIQLFNTSSHGIELTREGQDARKSFAKMLKEYDSLRTKLEGHRRQMSGHIKLGILYYSFSDLFADFLPFFNNKYPDIKVECLNYRPQELLDDLLAGLIDIGQVIYTENKNSKLQYQNIAKADMIAVLNSRHPLAKSDSLYLSDLIGETLIELKNDRYSTEITREVFKKCGVSFNKVIETDNIETVPFACKEYNGIHITGGNCRKQQAVGISYIPVLDKHAHSTIAFAYLKTNNNPILEIFISEAKIFYC